MHNFICLKMQVCSYCIFKKKTKKVQLVQTVLFSKTKFFLQLGPVRPYETVRFFVNLGVLELTNRAQTFRDYSFSS